MARTITIVLAWVFVLPAFVMSIYALSKTHERAGFRKPIAKPIGFEFRASGAGGPVCQPQTNERCSTFYCAVDKQQLKDFYRGLVNYVVQFFIGKAEKAIEKAACAELGDLWDTGCSLFGYEDPIGIDCVFYGSVFFDVFVRKYWTR